MGVKASWLSPQVNNFTLLRLILATSVIYSHCFQVLTGEYHSDPLARYIGVPVSTFGVDGFFFLSGFLVYPSLSRIGAPLRFLGARLARIWPGLAVSVILTVVVGAFFSTAGGLAYLNGPTRDFILLNLSLMKGAYSLTGINCDGAPCNINGSLWTLPWEVRCYLLLAGLAVFGLASPRAMTRLTYPMTILFVVVWAIPAVRELAGHHLPPGRLFLIDLFHRLWPLFCLGTAAYVFRERLVLSWWILLGLVVLYAITIHSPVALQTRILLTGYAVLCFGLLSSDRFRISGHWEDYSYGMYIYAFPVMMLILGLTGQTNYLILSAETAALTLPFAVLSWKFVERPSLEMFRRHVRGKLPPAGDGPAPHQGTPPAA